MVEMGIIFTKANGSTLGAGHPYVLPILDTSFDLLQLSIAQCVGAQVLQSSSNSINMPIAQDFTLHSEHAFVSESCVKEDEGASYMRM